MRAMKEKRNNELSSCKQTQAICQSTVAKKKENIQRIRITGHSPFKCTHITWFCNTLFPRTSPHCWSAICLYQSIVSTNNAYHLIVVPCGFSVSSIRYENTFCIDANMLCIFGHWLNIALGWSMTQICRWCSPSEVEHTGDSVVCRLRGILVVEFFLTVNEFCSTLIIMSDLADKQNCSFKRAIYRTQISAI